MSAVFGLVLTQLVEKAGHTTEIGVSVSPVSLFCFLVQVFVKDKFMESYCVSHSGTSLNVNIQWRILEH